MTSLAQWLEDQRDREDDPVLPEILARLHKKHCPRCGASTVVVNDQGIYVCLHPDCIHVVPETRYGVALWWKFDPARDGGKGKDIKPHKAGWVHGTRMILYDLALDTWEPRGDGPWRSPKRRTP